MSDEELTDATIRAMQEHQRKTGGLLAEANLRDWFAGQYLASGRIDPAHESDLDRWFGKRRVNITTAEIVSRRAYEYADAMLKARQP